MQKEKTYYATGRRKSAIARTWLFPGTGKVIVNDRPADEYFATESSRIIMLQPMTLTKNTETFDVKVTVKGGGIAGQVGAIRHGITRALMLADPELRQILKKAGFVTRDPRVKERKKYGQRSARARFQFSKR
jgi:small subunit ribosomal protein S9